jgi:hypothetical protein
MSKVNTCIGITIPAAHGGGRGMQFVSSLYFPTSADVPGERNLIRRFTMEAMNTENAR